jgi:hypothetical protein
MYEPMSGCESAKSIDEKEFKNLLDSLSLIEIDTKNKFIVSYFENGVSKGIQTFPYETAQEATTIISRLMGE